MRPPEAWLIRSQEFWPEQWEVRDVLASFGYDRPLHASAYYGPGDPLVVDAPESRTIEQVARSAAAREAQRQAADRERVARARAQAKEAQRAERVLAQRRARILAALVDAFERVPSTVLKRRFVVQRTAPYVYREYPRMLYRFDGANLKYCIVQDAAERATRERGGWVLTQQAAMGVTRHAPITRIG